MRAFALCCTLLVFISCVPQSQYDKLMTENKKLKTENHKLRNSAERTIVLIEKNLKIKKYIMAKRLIEKLGKLHPVNKANKRFRKKLPWINKMIARANNATERKLKLKSINTSKDVFTLKNWSKKEIKIKESLSYLIDSVKQIKQIKIKKNIVIIAWNKIPSDFSVINRGAALQANKATDFGVHIWSVPSGHIGWDETQSYICETTARYGKVQNSSCR